jgi:AcrR family transcriptional regulator
VASRPPNRKELIRTAATHLFAQRGYHNVTVADVADAVGITPSALYHHFRSKQDLLLEVVLGSLDAVDGLIRGAHSLDDALRALADLVIGPPSTLAVWERQGRYLEGTQRQLIVEREEQVVSQLIPLLRLERPDLCDPDGELIARAVLGTFGSRSRHRLSLARRRDEQLMVHLGAVAAAGKLPEHEFGRLAAPANSGAVVAGVRMPRRDQLLAEAIRLFGERGYQSVSMNDIGEAAGIVASGVYRHYPSKTDLLVAAANRGEQRLRAGAEQALALASGPGDALEHLVRAHVTVAIEHRALVGILATEGEQLPDRERDALHRFHADYLDIWLQALRRLRPDGEPTEIKILVHAVQSMIYFVVRSNRVALHTGVDRDWLTELGMSLLAR